MSEPVFMSVIWDGPDVEMKMIGAIDQLVRHAKEAGMQPDAMCRVMVYFLQRAEADAPSPTLKQLAGE